jgi:hypothetical protein
MRFRIDSSTLVTILGWVDTQSYPNCFVHVLPRVVAVSDFFGYNTVQ